ncbi:unnamed protein product [Caenorhabditis sp. 36 PRJEB53466]|nr:unnamed protein product [Caenorhabditis sp. 36 PRJEB53466]
MSSRYSSSYTSRYGSGSGSSSYIRDRDRDRDTGSVSRYTANPKYTSYASKYSADSKKSNDKMENYTAAPIAKDEIEELSYDAKTPTTPIEDVITATQEVLQESQISDFVEEDDDKPTEIEEVKLTLSSQVDEDEDEEVRKAQELLASSTQIRDASPSPSPILSPILSKKSSPATSPAKEVKFAPDVFDNENRSETENRTPSPTVLNAKKLGGIPWPPKAADIKKDAADTDGVPKKRVSDLIARFNVGIIEESKKNDAAYKAEYGAGSNVGKVQTHKFN